MSSGMTIGRRSSSGKKLVYLRQCPVLRMNEQTHDRDGRLANRKNIGTMLSAGTGRP
jgi:hypothetical protein